MAIGHRLIAQAGIQVLGKITSTVFGVAAIAIITRGLGVAEFGSYATVMAYLQLFGIVVDLGLNVMTPAMLGELRDAGSDRALRSAQVLSSALTMRLLASVVAFTGAAALAWVIPAYSDAVRVGVAVATFGFLGIVCTQILTAPAQVALDMRLPVLADVAGRAALVGGLAFVAWRGYGLLPMIAVTSGANVLACLLTFAAARRHLPVRLAWDAAAWGGILTRSWPIALSILFNLVYLRADQVILSFLKPAEDVGLYAAPYRLIDVLTQFPHMVMGLVLPLLAAAWAARDRGAFTDRVQRTFDGLAILAFPLAAGAIILGSPIMTFVSGAAFASSGAILAVLALALLGIFLGQPFGYAVVALGQQKRMLWGYAAVAAVTLAGYLVLIPVFSYWGAAWMTVASETAIAVWTFLVVRAASGLRLSLRIAGAALLASAVMGFTLWFLPLPIIPRIGLGAIIYGLAAVALPSTRQVIRAALDNRPGVQ